MATNLPPETRVPALPDPNRDPEGFLRAVKEILEVREGVRGNQLDREVTFRDLVDVGLAAPVRGIAGRGRQPGSAILTPVGQGGAGGAVGTGVKPIMTVPPKPRDVTAVGTFASILLAWGEPDYANHAYAEVLRADVDDIGQAVLVGTSIGGQYADPVGETANKYYWIRFVSTSNVKGPASTVVNGKTALNPAFVMANLLATTWQPNTTYSQFQYVRPTVDNGMMYRAVQDGVSGATEPTWPTTVGQQRTDGSTRWIAAPASERAPFIIGTVNGQPAVVMDTAYIGDLTITTAKIKEAFLDNLTAIHGTLHFARIEKGQIFELAIGGEIKSATFSPLNNTGFIVRNEPGRDPDSPGLRQYTAEFYGDTLFSGDVRAARVLGGMLVGSVFGVPTDADNGAFEFIAIRAVVSDSVVIDRMDSTDAVRTINLQYNGVTRTYEIGNFVISYWPGNPYIGPGYIKTPTPFSGLIAGLPDPMVITVDPDGLDLAGKPRHYSYHGKRVLSHAFASSLWQFGIDGRAFNSARIVGNPLNIISYNAVAPYNYNRFKRRDVPILLTFSRASRIPYHWLLGASGIFNWIRPGHISAMSNAAVNGVLNFRVKTGTKQLAHFQLRPNFYWQTTSTMRMSFNTIDMPPTILLSGTQITTYVSADLVLVQQPSGELHATYSDSRLEVFLRIMPTGAGYVGSGVAENSYYSIVVAGSYILFKGLPFSNPEPVGIHLEIDNKSGVAGRSQLGLDVGIVMSTSMDNEA